MKNIWITAVLLSLLLAANAQTAAKLHQKAIVVDTHGDIISDQINSGIDIGLKQSIGNFDLVRAKEGGLDVQVFSIWCDGSGGYAMANRQIDSLEALVKRYPDKISLVRNAVELKLAVRQGKLAALIGVEGGHMIEDRLDYLEALAKRGMSYMTLTWNNSTSWASSAADETSKKNNLKNPGLNDLGKQIIKRMNELGVIVDLSHVGEKAFYDAIAISKKPVMASHSSAYVFNAHSRNLKDEQIRAIAKTGGVVFVNFYSGFLDSTYSTKQSRFNAVHSDELESLTKKYNSKTKAGAEIKEKYRQELEDMRTPLSLLINHIDHIAKLVGSTHVGLGADYDGAESYPKGLDDVSKYPLVTEALLQRGYSSREVKNIMGANFVRLLKNVK